MFVDFLWENYNGNRNNYYRKTNCYSQQEVVQKEVKPSRTEAVSKGMLAYHGRKAREERDELAEKNKKQAAEIRKLKRELNKAKKSK